MSKSKSSLGSSTSSSSRTSPAPTLLSSAIEGYLKYFAEGHSNTSRAKRLDLDRFLDSVRVQLGYSKAEKVLLKDFTAQTTRRFVADCLKKGEAPSTVARRLATVKHMGSTLASRYRNFDNPTTGVKPPEVLEKAPKRITPVEVKQIHRVAKSRLTQKDSFIRHRNIVLFEFLITTGLRVEEVRQLRLSQITADLESVNRVATTGRKFRSVLLPSTIRRRLRTYLEKREQELQKFYRRISPREDGLHPVFVSTYGAKAGEPESFLMGAKSVWRAINELSANIELHPHLLRHAYAMDILQRTGDVKAVANALGHSDLRLTDKYHNRKK